MGILISTVAALSTFYSESRNVHDPKIRRKQIVRLIGKMPTWPPTPTGIAWAFPTWRPIQIWATPRIT